jgi:acyl-CoA thioesterase FadM
VSGTAETATSAEALDGHRVQMRWRDIDGLRHVNHVVALTYLEEGRDAFHAERGIGRDQYVVGRCSVSWIDEIELDRGAVLVQCRVRELGRSSLTTSERILDEDGHVTVEAEFGLVLWDPERRTSREISESERKALGEEIG